MVLSSPLEAKASNVRYRQRPPRVVLGNGSRPNGKNRGDEQSWNHCVTLSDMSSDIMWAAGWECHAVRLEGRRVGASEYKTDMQLCTADFTDICCCEQRRQGIAGSFCLTSSLFLWPSLSHCGTTLAGFCISEKAAFLPFLLSHIPLRLSIPSSDFPFDLHSWGTVTISLNDNKPSS